MGDSMPNYKLEQQRLRAAISAQQSNIEKQLLDIMEMEDRKQRHEDNIAASEKAIAELRAKLDSLEAAHGK